MTLPNRREFLRTVAASAAGAALASAPKTSAYAAANDAVEKIFSEQKLTDQHGKPFDPVTLFGDKPFLVLFGYGGCPLCQQITDSVAGIQQELVKQGQNVPIVVVSVQPETDKGGMARYVSSYYVKGMRQFANEPLLADDGDVRREQGETAFDAAEKKPQSDRILHVVCPETADKAKELQRRMELMSNPNDPKSHSAFVTLFSNGEKQSKYRALPPYGTPHPEFISGLAAEVVKGVTPVGQQQVR